MAIWTTSTLTVTTKPVRPTADATIVVSTVCAVSAEYPQPVGDSSRVWKCTATAATATPRRAASSGSTQRLPRMLWRARKRRLHITGPIV